MQDDTEAPPLLLSEISPFVKSHCLTCAAGWLRQYQNDYVKIVCLLDRESVWPQLQECSRYEPQEQD